MQPDITTLHHWYAGPLGQVVVRVVQAQLLSRWASVAGERVLIIGYAEPYAELWASAQLFWGMPAAMGGYAWPAPQGCQSLLLHGQALPFADQTFDRIILIHALEFSPNPEGLLAECYRVMYPAGRLMVITPNRLGVWSRREGTPFASGVPYSGGPLRRLLGEKGFRLMMLRSCLFVPPVYARLVHRHVRWWERLGQAVTPAMGGILVAEASKDVLGGRVIRAREDRLGLLGVVRPQPAA